MARRSPRPNEPPYGMANLMRPGAVADSLGVDSRTIGRVRRDIHRLALGNGSLLYPIGYVASMVAFADAAPKLSITAVAQNFAVTAQAQELMDEAERGFSDAVEASLSDTEGDERLIGAASIARLLGYRRTAITDDWAIRPNNLLVPVASNHAGIADLWFEESNFRAFCQWMRPEILAQQPPQSS